jgi:hypothetical protein
LYAFGDKPFLLPEIYGANTALEKQMISGSVVSSVGLFAFCTSNF